MVSIREHLTNIGIARNELFSYRSLQSRPDSLLRAVRAMVAPQSWTQVGDVSRDECWTDEVQGVCWDGANWIFSCNAKQSKPNSYKKSMYIFPWSASLKDDSWSSKITYNDVPHPYSMYEEYDHWGTLTYHKGRVYVSHFWDGGPRDGRKSVVIFINHGGSLQYERWVELEEVTSSDGESRVPEFQAVNPWDGKLYSCLGGSTVREFFVHDPESGEWDGKQTLRLSGGIPPQKVQGACFSPNGHLYVAVDARFSDFGTQYKWIFYYSALNGAFLGKIPILAEEEGTAGEGEQELEGLCYGNISKMVDFPWGKELYQSQIHVILLENHAALDNLFFKSFRADLPDSV